MLQLSQVEYSASWAFSKQKDCINRDLVLELKLQCIQKWCMKQARFATVVLAKLYFFRRSGSEGLYEITIQDVPASSPLQVITAVWKMSSSFIRIR